LIYWLLNKYIVLETIICVPKVTQIKINKFEFRSVLKREKLHSDIN